MLRKLVKHISGWVCEGVSCLDHHVAQQTEWGRPTRCGRHHLRGVSGEYEEREGEAHVCTDTSWLNVFLLLSPPKDIRLQVLQPLHVAWCPRSSPGASRPLAVDGSCITGLAHSIVYSFLPWAATSFPGSPAFRQPLWDSPASDGVSQSNKESLKILSICLSVYSTG